MNPFVKFVSRRSSLLMMSGAAVLLATGVGYIVYDTARSVELAIAWGTSALICAFAGLLAVRASLLLGQLWRDCEQLRSELESMRHEQGARLALTERRLALAERRLGRLTVQIHRDGSVQGREA